MFWSVRITEENQSEVNDFCRHIMSKGYVHANPKVITREIAIEERCDWDVGWCEANKGRDYAIMLLGNSEIKAFHGCPVGKYEELPTYAMTLAEVKDTLRVWWEA